MKLMVVSPMYWADLETAHRMAWLYLASCRKAGIGEDIRREYVVGSQQYPGETVMHVNGMVDFLKANSDGFTHVLSTHAWDALFVQPLDEIIRRYEAMGSPSFFHAAAIQRANIHTDEGPSETTWMAMTTGWSRSMLARWVCGGGCE